MTDTVSFLGSGGLVHRDACPPEPGVVNIPGQLSFDDIGKVRATDPHTSELAAVAQIGRKAATQRRVLEALYRAGEDGLTDFELGAVLGMQQTSCGVRRGELRDAGLVMKASREDGTILTRPSPSGSPSICWTLTATGIIHTDTRPS